MKQELANTYGNRVRVRACGLCWQDENLLMVNHSGITPTNFWAPPGGGVDFGLSLSEVLQKEFREETGLHVNPGEFRFGCEFIQKPIHAIELFYSIREYSGELIRGSDPEIQIIQDVRFLSPDAISRIPPGELHGIFRFISSPLDLKTLTGFFKI